MEDALAETSHPNTVVQVERTAEVVVTVAAFTPKDVLVKQTSADSVLHSWSG